MARPRKKSANRKKRGVAAPADLQIACWMSDEEAEALEHYAGELEISRAALCALLVQQEIRERRLLELAQHYPAYTGLKEGFRVTARIKSRDLKVVFSKHVRACALGSDEAAWLLFNSEPAERSLIDLVGWKASQGAADKHDPDAERGERSGNRDA